MVDVQFFHGTAEKYNAIAHKDDHCFYYTTDTKDLYIGEQKLTNQDEIDAAVERIAQNETDITEIKKRLDALTVLDELGESTSNPISQRAATKEKFGGYVGVPESEVDLSSLKPNTVTIIHNTGNPLEWETVKEHFDPRLYSYLYDTYAVAPNGLGLGDEYKAKSLALAKIFPFDDNPDTDYNYIYSANEWFGFIYTADGFDDYIASIIPVKVGDIIEPVSTTFVSRHIDYTLNADKVKFSDLVLNEVNVIPMIGMSETDFSNVEDIFDSSIIDVLKYIQENSSVSYSQSSTIFNMYVYFNVNSESSIQGGRLTDTAYDSKDTISGQIYGSIYFRGYVIPIVYDSINTFLEAKFTLVRPLPRIDNIIKDADPKNFDLNSEGLVKSDVNNVFTLTDENGDILEKFSGFLSPELHDFLYRLGVSNKTKSITLTIPFKLYKNDTVYRFGFLSVWYEEPDTDVTSEETLGAPVVIPVFVNKTENKNDQAYGRLFPIITTFRSSPREELSVNADGKYTAEMLWTNSLNILPCTSENFDEFSNIFDEKIINFLKKIKKEYKLTNSENYKYTVYCYFLFNQNNERAILYDSLKDDRATDSVDNAFGTIYFCGSTIPIVCDKLGKIGDGAVVFNQFTLAKTPDTAEYLQDLGSSTTEAMSQKAVSDLKFGGENIITEINVDTLDSDIRDPLKIKPGYNNIFKLSSEGSIVDKLKDILDPDIYEFLKNIEKMPGYIPSGEKEPEFKSLTLAFPFSTYYYDRYDENEEAYESRRFGFLIASGRSEPLPSGISEGLPVMIPICIGKGSLYDSIISPVYSNFYGSPMSRSYIPENEKYTFDMIYTNQLNKLPVYSWDQFSEIFDEYLINELKGLPQVQGNNTFNIYLYLWDLAESNEENRLFFHNVNNNNFSWAIGILYMDVALIPLDTPIFFVMSSQNYKLTIAPIRALGDSSGLYETNYEYVDTAEHLGTSSSKFLSQKAITELKFGGSHPDFMDASQLTSIDDLPKNQICLFSQGSNPLFDEELDSMLYNSSYGLALFVQDLSQTAWTEPNPQHPLAPYNRRFDPFAYGYIFSYNLIYNSSIYDTDRTYGAIPVKYNPHTEKIELAWNTDHTKFGGMYDLTEQTTVEELTLSDLAINKINIISNPLLANKLFSNKLLYELKQIPDINIVYIYLFYIGDIWPLGINEQNLLVRDFNEIYFSQHLNPVLQGFIIPQTTDYNNIFLPISVCGGTIRSTNVLDLVPPENPTLYKDGKPYNLIVSANGSLVARTVPDKIVIVTDSETAPEGNNSYGSYLGKLKTMIDYPNGTEDIAISYITGAELSSITEEADTTIDEWITTNFTEENLPFDIDAVLIESQLGTYTTYSKLKATVKKIVDAIKELCPTANVGFLDKSKSSTNADLLKRIVLDDYTYIDIGDGSDPKKVANAIVKSMGWYKTDFLSTT